jgi:hypothetical protein
MRCLVRRKAEKKGQLRVVRKRADLSLVLGSPALAPVSHAPEFVSCIFYLTIYTYQSVSLVVPADSEHIFPENALEMRSASTQKCAAKNALIPTHGGLLVSYRPHLSARVGVAGPRPSARVLVAGEGSSDVGPSTAAAPAPDRPSASPSRFTVTLPTVEAKRGLRYGSGASLLDHVSQGYSRPSPVLRHHASPPHPLHLYLSFPVYTGSRTLLSAAAKWSS